MIFTLLSYLPLLPLPLPLPLPALYMATQLPLVSRRTAQRTPTPVCLVSRLHPQPRPQGPRPSPNPLLRRKVLKVVISSSIIYRKISAMLTFTTCSCLSGKSSLLKCLLTRVHNKANVLVSSLNLEVFSFPTVCTYVCV